ncbi:efflux RND transporter periplasmic adaptor subunit [Mesorhizobium sp. WSM3224]|uniref:efflux RND transporter periplasmic adaptor subunit n=1 Tax=Mesorhizobium sp. WSM3224 TaxID=1040986 RepID=UPI000423500C|nr:efflux RND transporter periplasmic adaptor subunit [Mesorhizobium sp. WSM3224]
MKARSRRRFRLWLAIMAASTIGLYFVGRQWATDAPLPSMTIIRHGDIETAVLATGTLKPKRLIAIGAQATGRILSLHVKPGQQVKADDLVALIDSEKQQNQLKKAQATLVQHQASRDENIAKLELARQDFARAQVMMAKNAIASSEYDKALATLKSKQAQLAISEAVIAVSTIEVQIAEGDLAHTRITAPIDGTILITLVQEGQTLNAQQSVPTVAILGQLDTMVVEVDISEVDMTQVHEGLPLYFTVSGQNSMPYAATLERIELAPDSIVNDKSFRSSNGISEAPPSAVYYKGIFNVPNPDGFLKTYMTAEVHMILAKATNVLLAPISAVRRSDTPNKATVRVDVGGTIEERTVETGITDKINIEIRSTLRDGDKIVTDNQAPTPTAADI